MREQVIMAATEDGWAPRSDVAALVGVSVSALRRWIEAGQRIQRDSVVTPREEGCEIPGTVRQQQLGFRPGQAGGPGGLGDKAPGPAETRREPDRSIEQVASASRQRARR